MQALRGKQLLPSFFGRKKASPAKGTKIIILRWLLLQDNV
jgi:hypothetical protein